jgi:hypothetical protein
MPVVVPEPPAEPVAVEPIPEAAVPSELPPAVETSNERSLPTDWQQLTNRELIALCTENGVKVPEKITKASLIQVLESWLTEV